MKKIIAVGIIAMSLVSGCATVVNGPRQDMRIDTKDAKGKLITTSVCYLNDETEGHKAGEKFKTSGSFNTMRVTCRDKSQPLPAKAILTSSFDYWMFGNIFIGGGLGTIVDVATGAGWPYPEWVQLVYGQDLIFDRTYGTGKNAPVEPSTRITDSAFNSYAH
ncbi:hypothetical protein [Zymobacter sp. IVIA_12111.31 C1]|uniref:hypothetical protein n=1 Tax=Zymobacter sp. IVIA_12111.31 C1 TaxID=3394854 RepID=UPI0039C2E9B8